MNSFLNKNLNKDQKIMEQQVLEVSTLTDKDKYSSNDNEATFLITLKGCDKITSRNPQNLIFVIDISGSMDKKPIELVKESILFTIKQLKNKDTITVIVFNDSAKIVLNEYEIGTEIVKEKTSLFNFLSSNETIDVSTLINDIKAVGNTNLSEGLNLGLEKYLKMSNKNYSSILLQTDGKVTRGVTRTEDIIKIVKKFNEKNKLVVPINTFGFDSEHNQNLLKGLSDIGKGAYYYIILFPF